MKIFPAWMYRDPCDVAERVEGAVLRAEARSRADERAREQLDRVEQSALDRMVRIPKRAIFAPPEIRMKRARIQALARAAMKAGK